MTLNQKNRNGQEGDRLLFRKRVEEFMSSKSISSHVDRYPLSPLSVLYIYIYRERERKGEREINRKT